MNSDCVYRGNKLIIIEKNIKTSEVRKIEVPNLIVYNGREWLLGRIFNTTVAGKDPSYYLRYMSFGSGGAPSGDPFNPIPPQPTDSGLVSEHAIKSGYPDNGKKHPFDVITPKQDPNNGNRYLIMEIQVTLDVDEPISQPALINEAGLWVSPSGTNPTAFILFARTTFPTIYKYPDVIIQFFWYVYV